MKGFAYEGWFLQVGVLDGELRQELFHLSPFERGECFHYARMDAFIASPGGQASEHTRFTCPEYQAGALTFAAFVEETPENTDCVAWGRLPEALVDGSLAPQEPFFDLSSCAVRDWGG
jgi:hypothetical protein